MRINNTGSYEFCRWTTYTHKRPSFSNIRDIAPLEYFQQHMAPIRDMLLRGERYDLCSDCYRQESHGKISGRERQLIKIGVDKNNWHKTMASSPWFEVFKNSDGGTDQMPVDWHIDLGNLCNSACIFCCPDDSSRLASEWQMIGFTQEKPSANWTDDVDLVDRFVHDLAKIPNIRYIHFIGGEPLLIPAFRTILERLVHTGLAESIDIGFTTNLTIWDNDIIDLMSQFHQVNVGISIESLHDVNDYLRYPSKLFMIKRTAEAWLEKARQHGWLCQIRITPTWLSIGHLLTVYDYAWHHQITVESCNFLEEPVFLKPNVLPDQYRSIIIDQLNDWIQSHQSTVTVSSNTRNPNFYQATLVHDLASYCRYLENEADLSHCMPQAVDFIQRLEKARKNCILDVLPEYESLLSAHGYHRP